jgi:hypothetical protein
MVPTPAMAKTLPSLVRTRMGASPPKPKCENSTTDAASMVAMPASTALPPLVNMRMPASVAYSEPPATAPRVPREGKRMGAAPAESTAEGKGCQENCCSELDHYPFSIIWSTVEERDEKSPDGKTLAYAASGPGSDRSHDREGVVAARAPNRRTSQCYIARSARRGWPSANASCSASVAATI